MARVLITGNTGFAGRFLTRVLEEGGHEVFGLDLGARCGDLDAARLSAADVADRDAVRQTFAGTRPDLVFHLAGRTFVPESWDRPEEHFRVNLGGTLNVLEAAREHSPAARVILAGSGDIYGLTLASGEPVSEESPCQPASPYAVSKLAADLLGLNYHRKYGLDVVRLRLFNHTGPGQREQFALPCFASQIARAESGGGPAEMVVGNLDAIRSFTDVRDVARAYALAALRGRPGACYNVGRSPSYRVRDLLAIMLGLARVPVRVVFDPDRLRSGEVPAVVCDASRFARETGWQPQIPIERTLEDLLDYWRERTRETGRDVPE